MYMHIIVTVHRFVFFPLQEIWMQILGVFILCVFYSSRKHLALLSGLKIIFLLWLCIIFFSKTGERESGDRKIKNIKDLTEGEHRRRSKNRKHSQKKAMTDSSNIPDTSRSSPSGGLNDTLPPNRKGKNRESQRNSREMKTTKTNLRNAQKEKTKYIREIYQQM